MFDFVLVHILILWRFYVLSMILFLGIQRYFINHEQIKACINLNLGSPIYMLTFAKMMLVKMCFFEFHNHLAEKGDS